jgi:hypothetical protein
MSATQMRVDRSCLNELMGPVAADYTWFDEEFRGDLAEAYCWTVALGVAPEEYLRRLGAQVTERRQGITGLYDLALDLVEESGNTRQFVAVASCEGADGPAALAVEPNGYLGVRDDVMFPVSKGTRTVAHQRNIEWLDEFLWVEDGEIRLRFEPYRPFERWGMAQDALVGQMEEAGFVLDEDIEDDDQLGPYSAAAFALAERLTGVRVTSSLLNNSTYLCGIARIP